MLLWSRSFSIVELGVIFVLLLVGSGKTHWTQNLYGTWIDPMTGDQMDFQGKYS